MLNKISFIAAVATGFGVAAGLVALGGLALAAMGDKE
jgi:hypothetical protein